MKPTVHVIATTADGTRAALAAAAPLARGVGASLVVLVPHIVSSPAELEMPVGSAAALVRRYEEMARALGADATVEIVASVGLRDLVARACAVRSRIVVGGPVGRWLTSPEERFANRLAACGCSVLFAASGRNTTQRRVAA